MGSFEIEKSVGTSVFTKHMISADIESFGEQEFIDPLLEKRRRLATDLEMFRTTVIAAQPRWPMRVADLDTMGFSAALDFPKARFTDLHSDLRRWDIVMPAWTTHPHADIKSKILAYSQVDWEAIYALGWQVKHEEIEEDSPMDLARKTKEILGNNPIADAIHIPTGPDAEKLQRLHMLVRGSGIDSINLPKESEKSDNHVQDVHPDHAMSENTDEVVVTEDETKEEPSNDVLIEGAKPKMQAALEKRIIPVMHEISAWPVPIGEAVHKIGKIMNLQEASVEALGKFLSDRKVISLIDVSHQDAKIRKWAINQKTFLVTAAVARMTALYIESNPGKWPSCKPHNKKLLGL